MDLVLVVEYVAQVMGVVIRKVVNGLPPVEVGVFSNLEYPAALCFHSLCYIIDAHPRIAALFLDILIAVVHHQICEHDRCELDGMGEARVQRHA